jgi:hypothetical protein
VDDELTNAKEDRPMEKQLSQGWSSHVMRAAAVVSLLSAGWVGIAMFRFLLPGIKGLPSLLLSLCLAVAGFANVYLICRVVFSLLIDSAAERRQAHAGEEDCHDCA